MDAARQQVEVLAPPPALAARGVVCAIRRRVVAADPPQALESWVQANRYACLNVVTEGCVLADDTPLPAAFLTGPFAAPLRTVVPGTLASLSLVLQPWWLQPLAGVPASYLADRLVDVEGLAAPRLRAACAAARLACAEPQRIAELWSVLAEVSAAPPALALEVLRADGVAQAAAACGVSARHYRRRFAHALGLNPAAWLRIGRWEEALPTLAGPAAPLADLAARHGYADQAHLARDTRAFVHASPARLRQALAGEAAAWSLAPARSPRR